MATIPHAHPHSAGSSPAGHHRFDVDFGQTPLLVIWEVTRSCELACLHCRADAMPQRHPQELDLDEGRRLIDEVADMGTPLIIFSGGDPLQREDLEELVRHAKGRDLRVGTIPATTGRLTRERMASLQAAGVDQMALSIDGETAAKHDAFRQVPGSFAKAMQGAAWAAELGVPLQVNTVFGAWNVDDFAALSALVESLNVVFWEVFFLVPTGRGTALQGCTAEQFEQLFEKLYALTQRVSFVVKITEGQHYRRYMAQRHAADPGRAVRQRMPRVAVNAGRGICFVDHTGVISPSGFLPVPCGSVRDVSLAETYRGHPVFTALRDVDRLEGPCGICDYREVCGGGSRARAYGMTGQLHAPEPCCTYGQQLTVAREA